MDESDALVVATAFSTGEVLPNKLTGLLQTATEPDSTGRSVAQLFGTLHEELGGERDNEAVFRGLVSLTRSTVTDRDEATACIELLSEPCSVISGSDLTTSEYAHEGQVMQLDMLISAYEPEQLYVTSEETIDGRRAQVVTHLPDDSAIVVVEDEIFGDVQEFFDVNALADVPTTARGMRRAGIPDDVSEAIISDMSNVERFRRTLLAILPNTVERWAQTNHNRIQAVGLLTEITGCAVQILSLLTVTQFWLYGFGVFVVGLLIWAFGEAVI